MHKELFILMIMYDLIKQEKSGSAETLFQYLCGNKDEITRSVTKTLVKIYKSKWKVNKDF